MNAGKVSRSSFGKRLVGAAMLQRRIFAEVEHDPHATRQTVYLLVLISLAQAYGQNLLLREAVQITFADVAPLFASHFIATFVGLGVWSLIVYAIGTRLFNARAMPVEVWRCSGFARSPGLLYLLPALVLPATVWLIVAQIVAAREALDISLPKAFLTCLLGAVPFLLLIVLGGLGGVTIPVPTRL